MVSLVWFRDDLRLADHAALSAAADDPGGLVALFVLDEESPGVRPLGGAAKWWLHHSLVDLQRRLAERGVPLVLRRGRASQVLPEVVAEIGATSVFWNRRYGAERQIDAAIKSQLREDGVAARSFQGGLLFEPWTITTQADTPYKVYSAFWRACLAEPAPAEPLPVPKSLTPAESSIVSDDVADWQLLPTAPNWAAEFGEHWQPGEQAALERLETFLTERVGDYKKARDFPAEDATSNLAPHLRFGEISPRTVWHEAVRSGSQTGDFLSEIGWREFAWHTLFHHPDLHERGLDARFNGFGWQRPDTDRLTAWQQGSTGFGLVDAGMRQLWRTGTMHNRVRMVTASFLTKNLLLDWRIGEAWFWDTLVDADAASNPFNWQWVAGCGADAAPYFRIFNPETQQKKFDPQGHYVERWAPESVLQQPIVDLKATRERALDAFDQIKGAQR